MTWPPGWKLDAEGKRVSVEVETEDFLDAVRLLHEIAPLAEQLEHHPDFHLTGYNKVRIVSYSHDVGHLTERDEKLAREIQKVLQRHGLSPTA